jgi:hypothetical protein
MYPPNITIEQIQTKLLNRISIDNNDCWVWQGAKSKSGYGYWTEGLHKPMWRVHRLMWALTHNEAMPRTKRAMIVIDHVCSNKLCFRPSHLQKISQRENVRRSDKRRNNFSGCNCCLVSIDDLKIYKTTKFNRYYRCRNCDKHVNVEVVERIMLTK